VLLAFWAVNRRGAGVVDGGVREDQPVAADMAAPEPGAGVPVQRTDEPAVAPAADSRPSTA
jgi:hypothetical protein